MGLLFARERSLRCAIAHACDLAETATDAARRAGHRDQARKLARELPASLAERMLIRRG